MRIYGREPGALNLRRRSAAPIALFSEDAFFAVSLGLFGRWLKRQIILETTDKRKCFIYTQLLKEGIFWPRIHPRAQ